MPNEQRDKACEKVASVATDGTLPYKVGYFAGPISWQARAHPDARELIGSMCTNIMSPPYLDGCDLACRPAVLSWSSLARVNEP